ncbi:hypothetical protein [Burkholderia ubonensis]|nr:hypothetical protein [Burkholderia ubonensis]
MLPRIGHAILRTTLNGPGLSAIEVGASDGQFVDRIDEEETT